VFKIDSSVVRATLLFNKHQIFLIKSFSLFNSLTLCLYLDDDCLTIQEGKKEIDGKKIAEAKTNEKKQLIFRQMKETGADKTITREMKAPGNQSNRSDDKKIC